MYELSASLPTNEPSRRNAFGDAISNLAEVCRRLNTEHRVIIHGSGKPVNEWRQSDGVSVGWDTAKLRGKIQSGDTLYMNIKYPGDLSVEDIVKTIRKGCSDISILETNL